MSFNVSALSDYTRQNATRLYTGLVTGAETAMMIKEAGNVMVGVKSAETINIMDTDAVFQTGGVCGFNASGSTSFTQRTVTVGKVKVNESLCPKSLEAKYMQEALTQGSTYDSVLFATEYTDKKNKRIQAQLETAIWQGDTGSGNVNLNKFDGFIKLIGAAAGVINANVSGYVSGAPLTSITKTNVIAALKGVKNAIPQQVKYVPDMRIWVGYDVFDLIVDAHVDLNLFNYGQQNIGNGEFTIPGTTYKVKAVHGLDGTGDIYAIRLSNMFLGTDLLNEEERYELFFAKEADEFRFIAEWKMGVNIAFPDEVVKLTT